MTPNNHAKSLNKPIHLSLVFILALLLATLPATADTTETIHYYYDNALQLIKTVYQGGAQLDYVFDNMGNRTAMTESTAAPANNPPNVPTAATPANGATNVDDTALS